MMTEVIVYGHACLSQARLLERLETFQRRTSDFHWPVYATPYGNCFSCGASG